MAEAFACHRRFQHLTNRTAEYGASIEDQVAVVTETRFGEARFGSLLMSDYSMMVGLHLMRGIAVSPPTVRVFRSRRSTMPAPQREAFEGFFGAPIELGARQAQLVIDAEFLQSAVKTADDELAGYFRGVLQRASGFGEQSSALLDDASRVIRDQLVKGTPSVADVAQALGLGRRTFQRRLSEVDRTFAHLLEQTRRTLAEGYLADSTLSLAEVAYLLGYKEHASFHRAFRRWHETTPAEYRRRLLVPS